MPSVDFAAVAEPPLWTPSPARAAGANLHRLRSALSSRLGVPINDYKELHTASVAHPGEFWAAVWDDCGLVGERGERMVDREGMPGTRFFPDAQICYAENLLQRKGPGDAIVFWGEDKARARWSWDHLRSTVAGLQRWLLAQGVTKGDRVAAMLPNMPETIAVLLAVNGIGAVFSSCSPDFGVRGVMDRFGQIEPKVFVSVDGYHYANKPIMVGDKVREVAGQLPTVKAVLVVDYLGEAGALAESLGNGTTFADAVAPSSETEPIFERMPFSHPLYILFSSGTTGIPKCIVHSAGGSLIQHVKEHAYQCDLREGDRAFYFATCGWMMWNWLVSGLALGETLCLYDGSPFHPAPGILFDYAEQEKFALFGTSAKYLDGLRKANLRPRDTHDLSSLRAVTSTGSPLAPETFSYVYQAIKSDLHLASISGGTDIVSCFVLGDPTAPVYRGEIQAAGLGMAVDVWSEDGRPVRCEKGELVCTKPFPSMPVGFWNDPQGKKYRAAYFERFPGVWHHGDFAEWTARGGMVIHGRSDATLNPQGVRIGTAEIYAQVELIPEVVEALAIGQDWDNDVRVVLFVRLAQGKSLTPELVKRIKDQIRTGASPRHVPAVVLAVADFPRTRSGKLTELAVREVVAGREVKNVEAIANPESLALFMDLPELAK
ncbi:acetoacetyl-CoA synthetase [Hyaloraphidium curvatum]|nr:acetoacetyl-CoA synthetase [Hyaloraphidium curvatum]